MVKFDIRVRDSCELLDQLEQKSVDLVITDPAYESLEKHRAKGTTTRLKQSAASSNEWFPIFRNDRFDELFEKLWVVMKPNTHLYMFCDQETMFVAKPIGERHGFTFWKPLVWKKLGPIGMGYHYRALYEVILFFEKGKRKLNDLSIPDVLEAKRVRGGYPTEKPVDLLTTLVKQSSEPGEVVIDPFSGSGATGVAAVQQGRDYLGGDIKESAVERAITRLVEAGAERVPGFSPISAEPQQMLF